MASQDRLLKQPGVFGSMVAFHDEIAATDTELFNANETDAKEAAVKRLNDLKSFSTAQQLLRAFALAADFKQEKHKQALFVSVEKGSLSLADLQEDNSSAPVIVVDEKGVVKADKATLINAAKKKISSFLNDETLALEFLKHFSTEKRTLPPEALRLLQQLAKKFLSAAEYILKTPELAQILDKDKSARFEIYKQHPQSLKLAFATLDKPEYIDGSKPVALDDKASENDRKANLAVFMTQEQQQKAELDIRVRHLSAQKEAYKKLKELNDIKLPDAAEAKEKHTLQLTAQNDLIAELAKRTQVNDESKVEGGLAEARKAAGKKQTLLDTLGLRHLAALQNKSFDQENNALGSFLVPDVKLLTQEQCWQNVVDLIARQPNYASLIRAKDVEAMFALANSADKFKQVLKYLLNSNKEVLVASKLLEIKNGEAKAASPSAINIRRYASEVTLQDAPNQHTEVYQQLFAGNVNGFVALLKKNSNPTDFLAKQKTWVTGKHILHVAHDLAARSEKAFVAYLQQGEAGKKPLNLLVAEVQTYFNDNKSDAALMGALSNNTVCDLVISAIKPDVWATTKPERDATTVRELCAASLIRIRAANTKLGFVDSIGNIFSSSYGNDARTKISLKSFADDIKDRNNVSEQVICEKIAKDDRLWTLLLATVPSVSTGFLGWGVRTQEQRNADLQRLADSSDHFARKLGKPYSNRLEVQPVSVQIPVAPIEAAAELAPQLAPVLDAKSDVVADESAATATFTSPVSPKVSARSSLPLSPLKSPHGVTLASEQSAQETLLTKTNAKSDDDLQLHSAVDFNAQTTTTLAATTGSNASAALAAAAAKDEAEAQAELDRIDAERAAADAAAQSSLAAAGGGLDADNTAPANVLDGGLAADGTVPANVLGGGGLDADDTAPADVLGGGLDADDTAPADVLGGGGLDADDTAPTDVLGEGGLESDMTAPIRVVSGGRAPSAAALSDSSIIYGNRTHATATGAVPPPAVGANVSNTQELRK